MIWKDNIKNLQNIFYNNFRKKTRELVTCNKIAPYKVLSKFLNNLIYLKIGKHKN